MTGRRPGDPDPEVTQLTVPPELASVRVARRFVAELCSDAPLAEELCDDALLLTSELVTNAVLHGRSEVSVEVAASVRALRVTVADENSRHPLRVEEDADALDGRGLSLVEALADRWGVEDRALGKAVWFELSAS